MTLNFRSFATTYHPADVSEQLRKYEEINLKDQYSTKDTEYEQVKAPPKPIDSVEPNTFDVKIAKIKCQGNRTLDDETLQNFLADKVGDLNFASIKALPRAISAFYLSKGYYAYAFIPKQTIKDHVLIIQIIEAKLDQLIFDKDPDSAVDETMAKNFLNQTEGEIINLNDLKERLKILNNVPGVDAGVAVEPGKNLGTSNLKVSLKDKDRFLLTSSVNNYGNDSTGVYNICESFNANNPFGLGDSLKTSASGSLGTKVLSATYGLPAGFNGNRIYASVSLMKIKVIGDQAYLKSYGQAETFEFTYVSPFQIGSGSGSLQLSLGHSHAVSTMLDVPVNDKSANRLSCALTFQLPDNYGSWNATIKPIVGILNLKNCQSDYNFDQLTARRNGVYQKFFGTLGRQQTLSENFSLKQTLNFQLSSKNLDSFEQFSMGGLSAVRAQPNASSGDEGLVYQTELAYKVTDSLSVSTFFDAGLVRINKRPWDLSSNTDGVQGYGFTINIATSWNFSCNAVIAFPLKRPNYQNKDMVNKEKPKLWLTASYKF